MTDEAKFKPGWLMKDVQKAAKRLGEPTMPDPRAITKVAQEVVIRLFGTYTRDRAEVVEAAITAAIEAETKRCALASIADVEAEREACAKVAQRAGRNGHGGQWIATEIRAGENGEYWAAIRGRGNKPASTKESLHD